MNVFRYDDLSTIAASRKLAAEVFGGPEWEKEAHKVYGKDPVADGVTSYAIGNCHVSLGRVLSARQSSTYHLQSSLPGTDRYRLAGKRCGCQVPLPPRPRDG